MNIIETDIPDVTEENIQESKAFLADNIIRNVYPLFEDVFQSKLKEYNEINELLKVKKKSVREEKNRIQNMVNDYRRIQKSTKLLKRIERLVESGLAYDSELKHQFIVLLKMVHKLPEKDLDMHLKRAIDIIHKRFST
jgi:hypothetical protein